eukprot:28676-Pelagococcus_subviridis.AAC.8
MVVISVVFANHTLARHLGSSTRARRLAEPSARLLLFHAASLPPRRRRGLLVRLPVPAPRLLHLVRRLPRHEQLVAAESLALGALALLRFLRLPSRLDARRAAAVAAAAAALGDDLEPFALVVVAAVGGLSRGGRPLRLNRRRSRRSHRGLRARLLELPLLLLPSPRSPLRGVRRARVSLRRQHVRDRSRQRARHDGQTRETPAALRLRDGLVDIARARGAAALPGDAEIPQPHDALRRRGDQRRRPPRGPAHRDPGVVVVVRHDDALHARRVRLGYPQRVLRRRRARVVPDDVAAFQPEHRERVGASHRRAHDARGRVEDAAHRAGLRARDRRSALRAGVVLGPARGERQELGLHLELGLVRDASSLHVPHRDASVRARGQRDRAGLVHADVLDAAAVRFQRLERVPRVHGPHDDRPVLPAGDETRRLRRRRRAVQLHALHRALVPG